MSQRRMFKSDPIRREDIPGILETVRYYIFQPLGITEYGIVGGGLKKEISNDVDILIKTNHCLNTIYDITSAVRCTDGIIITGFNQVSFPVEYKDYKGDKRIAQVDLMLTTDFKHSQFIYSQPADIIKILGYIAKTYLPTWIVNTPSYKFEERFFYSIEGLGKGCKVYPLSQTKKYEFVKEGTYLPNKRMLKNIEKTTQLLLGPYIKSSQLLEIGSADNFFALLDAGKFKKLNTDLLDGNEFSYFPDFDIHERDFEEWYPNEIYFLREVFMNNKI